MPWLLQLILHSWPSHSGNVENSAWPNTKRCLSNSPIFWVDSGWLFRIPMGSQKPNGHVEKTPKFYSFHQATPHGQGHRLRPRSSPRAAQAPVDPFQRLHLSKKSRSQVRIGRPRSMEYGTYMELIWNLYMESIWNSGIMTFIFVNFYVWNGMEWDRIQQKWNNLQNIIRQDPRPKQPKQTFHKSPTRGAELLSETKVRPTSLCSGPYLRHHAAGLWWFLAMGLVVAHSTISIINLKELQR